MMDTRVPDLHKMSYQGCSSLQLAKAQANDLITFTFFLNVEYASTNGYDLIFYKSKTDPSCKKRVACEVGCSHSRWGPRHPSYCKLVGLADAFDRGYEWVVYLDSDAFIANVSLPLPQLLQAYGADADAAAGAANASQQSFFGWDWPYTLGPNMGFMALRNSPSMRSMVSTCAASKPCHREAVMRVPAE